MTYGNFKDWTRWTAADKVLHDKAFNIAKNSKYDGYKRGLTSMVYKFFDKKTSGTGIKNNNVSNKQLANKLDKPITKKFNKNKVDKGSELYNRSMKLFLQNNDIEMYSTQNEGKSVVAERFIRTLRKKIYKYMTLHIIAQLKSSLLM